MNRITYIALAIGMLMTATTANGQNAPTISRDSVMSVVRAAEASNADALNILGSWYYTGQYLEQDYQMAARVWAKSASMGNTLAIGNLGMCYQFGHGVEADSTKAMGLYTKALRMGDPELLQSLRAAADRGGTFECMALGHIFTEGIGVQRDYPQAGHYYSIVARKGNVTAMRDAGLAYLNGKEYKDALTWMRKGADAGNTTCDYYYGMMLCEGLGTSADPVSGAVYVRRAANAGNSNAMYLLSSLYRDGKGVTKSLPEADEWLQKAAYKGLSKAMYDYAVAKADEGDLLTAAYYFSRLYNRRSFVPQMKELFTAGTAQSMLTKPMGYYALAVKALEAGDFEAVKANIKLLKKTHSDLAATLEARMLLNSNYAKHDDKKALKQLVKLAKKEPYAAVLLADIYIHGLPDGTSHDPATGIAMLNAQIDANNTMAMVALANAYYTGTGPYQSAEVAADLYRRALDLGYMTAAGAASYAEILSHGDELIDNSPAIAALEAAKYPASIDVFTALIP